MVVIAAFIALAVIVLVLSPFFKKQSPLLAHGSSINDPEVLRARKESLLKRYVEDESAHKRGSLSDVAWSKRRQFLVNRYVDAARRLDFLEKLSDQKAG